jgi:hypothetical protein
MLRGNADADQTGSGLRHDGDRRFVRPPPGRLAGQTHALRPAGQRSHRQHRHAGMDADHRGARPTQAAEMVDPRSGALLHHVGLHHPAHGLHRGLWIAVPAELPYPDHRAMGRAGLPAGLLRDRCLPRYRYLRGHPSHAQPARDRTFLAVLRLTQRRGVADPVHDLQRHLDLRAGSRVRGQQRHAPLRQGRVPVPAIRRDPQAAVPHRQRSYTSVSCSRS